MGFGPDLTEAEKNCLSCCVEEGVDDGEDVSLSFPDSQIGTNQEECIELKTRNGTLYTDATKDTRKLRVPYAAGVEGPYDPIMKASLKFDFYRVCVNAAAGFRYNR